VAAARRHPGPVSSGGFLPLDIIVPGLLSRFCQAEAGLRAVLSVGGAGDGGDAVGLLLKTLTRAYAGSPSWRATVFGDRIAILHALDRLALDSPAVYARMGRDKAAVAAVASALSAAAAPTKLSDEAVLLTTLIVACFSGVAGQPQQAAVDALPSIVAGVLHLLASPRADWAVFEVHVLACLMACSAVTERAAGGRIC
jgi:hypothetical protein